MSRGNRAVLTLAASKEASMACNAEEIKALMWLGATLFIVAVWNIAAAWLIVSPRKEGQHGAE